ncbi:MAG TPA: GNAT family N-acetyltransferase [Opitutaceae bacterium]|nr:GNAT family N-acetyltransferase [Opitutaceae bacterium]
MKIEYLTGDAAASRRPELAALLVDAVKHGASVGFVLPLAEGEADDYWRKIGAEIAAGQRLLLAAFDEAGRLIGGAQLALESRPNGRHRAEVQKVMVLASHRGRGIGAALMARVEAEARARGRRLLHLDTSVGVGGATAFYDRLGYTRVGGIPDFAANPDGTLAANAIYYKRLDATDPKASAPLSRNE